MAEKNSGAKALDFSTAPAYLKEFLSYSRTIRNLSVNTVNAYYIDLRTFLRFLAYSKSNFDLSETSFNEIRIDSITFEDIAVVTPSTVYDYLYFVTETLENAPSARARKLSSLRAFYHYYTAKTGKLEANPAQDIDIPSLKKTLPKYLTLDESLSLLQSVETSFTTRDYCILTLFLNCGMRLSELVSMNLSDFKDDTIRIIGKGNKERLVYLNGSCVSALEAYITERALLPKLVDRDALFISERQGKRLSARRVEQIVESCLKQAGLGGRGYSPHKLRHTAATLMYQHGNVDMLALKEILGHEHVTTTEIYTHISSAQLKDAVSSSPLAGVRAEKKKKVHLEDDDAEESL